ncbi:MAG: HEAT repeat domain-containing protein [Lentisphaeria bacterium]|nr:HEAT repeat domain-containing protein [Lentisphaeria bacterium]
MHGRLRRLHVWIGSAVAGVLILAAALYRGRPSDREHDPGAVGPLATPVAEPTLEAPPPTRESARPRSESSPEDPQGRDRGLTVPDAADFDRTRALVRFGTSDLKSLRRELWRLAKSTDPAALAILKEALASPSPQCRALAAAVLGGSVFAEAPALLRNLLQDPVPEVVCAAVRALAEVDSDALRQWGLPALEAGGLPTVVQAELLVALSRQGDESAIAMALEAAVTGADEELVAALLERAPGLPPDVAVPLFQAVIGTPGSSAEARNQAFEALSDVPGPEAAALLLEYAAQRVSAAERRGAAEALGTIPEAAIPAAALVAVVRDESDLQTRIHLYDAMRNLADPEPAVLLDAIRAESDPRAQTAALLSAGTLVGMGRADAAMGTYFASEGIPLLEASALSPALEAEYRMRAVSALRNAGTEAARAALDRLAQSGDEAIRHLASRPLPRRPP